MKREAGSGGWQASDTRYALRTRGFTLIELLVVIAILAVVTGLLVMVVYQLVTIPRWGNDQLAVDSDLRNAGLWLVRDGNESEMFTGLGCPSCPDDSTPCFVFDTGIEHGAVYTYTLSGDTLQRSTGGQTVGVARHVDSVRCPSSTTTGTVAIMITSTSGDVSASQIYTVTMRVR